jgi:hypothetical protein
VENIERRFEQLERQNRRMKLIGGFVLLVFSALFLVAWVSPEKKVLKAEELQIVDSEGNLKARFSTTGDGAKLCLYEKGGGAMISTPGPSLNFYDCENKKERFSVRLRDDGEPVLCLSDKNGVTRAELGCASTIDTITRVEHKHPESSLLLFNEKSKVIFQAP